MAGGLGLLGSLLLMRGGKEVASYATRYNSYTNDDDDFSLSMFSILDNYPLFSILPKGLPKREKY